MKDFKALCQTINADLRRCRGQGGIIALLREFLTGEAFKYFFWHRCCAYLAGRPLYKYTLFIPARLVLRHYKYRFGITWSYRCQVGPGIKLAHFGCVVVNDDVVVGRNVSLSHNITLGRLATGPRAGCPTLGDDVYVATGAVVVGKIHVGNGVTIGANAFVNFDVPAGSTVVGNPGRILAAKDVQTVEQPLGQYDQAVIPQPAQG